MKKQTIHFNIDEIVIDGLDSQFSWRSRLELQKLLEMGIRKQLMNQHAIVKRSSSLPRSVNVSISSSARPKQASSVIVKSMLK